MKETETSCVWLHLDELEVSSTVSTTVGLLVDIILVCSSSSDVSPSLGEMIESAIFSNVCILMKLRHSKLYVHIVTIGSVHSSK